MLKRFFITHMAYTTTHYTLPDDNNNNHRDLRELARFILFNSSSPLNPVLLNPRPPPRLVLSYDLLQQFVILFKHVHTHVI